MKFSTKFTELVMGLLTRGTAKVHINGLFTGEIEVGRGVRQGCPIAPFLFALCTEPLMAMLREKQKVGQIEGIKLPGGRSAPYNLFADDTELNIRATEGNYREVRELLGRYETAAGAKLNVRKSVLIPVSLAKMPLWMSSSGCRIPAQGEIVLHLGFPGGVAIQEAQVFRHLQNKIIARTSMWSNRWLSWPSRIVLTQKILPSLPAYILMTFGLCLKSHKALERTSRTFVWGTREDGSARQSSIAWEKLQRPKLEGGVRVLALADHSAAVKICQISKIMEGAPVPWTAIAREIILSDLANGRRKSERRLWTVEEALLLGPKMESKKSATLKQLLTPCDGSDSPTQERNPRSSGDNDASLSVVEPEPSRPTSWQSLEGQVAHADFPTSDVTCTANSDDPLFPVFPDRLW
ncbi:hypothetical protein R1sor_008594 [Riccia sorocarpa]|uniref:Reverse transcriptase domain-containing protein n=1 Tax=Riccia sorocarpa TaxID=122646 RepID=A0ABD3HU97_9MARC